MKHNKCSFLKERDRLHCL